MGKVLSRLARQAGVIDTPIKYEHRRKLNSLDVQDNSEASVQNGRSRQSKNKYSRCLLTDLTNSQDVEKFESQSSSQSSELVDYGTQPDVEVRSYEDYDWDQDCMVKFHRNENGGFERF